MAGTRHVLLCAFGCRPNSGSEDFLGWNWVESLAGCDALEVTVLTGESNRPYIEAHPAVNARFLYVDDAPISFRLPGELAEAVRYLLYSRRATAAVRRLDRRFDIAHHVSWTNIRTVSPAFAAGCPVVLGPVGGGQLFPRKLLRSLRPTARLIETVRNLQVLVSARAPRTRTQVRTAAVIVASNGETRRFAERLGAHSVVDMPDVPSLGPLKPRPTTVPGEPFELLWVGRLLPRKAVGLAVEAVKLAAQSIRVRLTIVGDGPERDRVESSDPGTVRWLGSVPRSELDEIYRSSHALLYTSLRDSGGPPLAEAMSFGLPAIIIDHQGPALLGRGWSLGVAPASAEQVIDGLASAIVKLASSPNLYAALSIAALERAGSLSQEARLEAALSWYETCMAEGPRAQSRRLLTARHLRRLLKASE